MLFKSFLFFLLGSFSLRYVGFSRLGSYDVVVHDESVRHRNFLLRVRWDSLHNNEVLPQLRRLLRLPVFVGFRPLFRLTFKSNKLKDDGRARGCSTDHEMIFYCRRFCYTKAFVIRFVDLF